MKNAGNDSNRAAHGPIATSSFCLAVKIKYCIVLLYAVLINPIFYDILDARIGSLSSGMAPFRSVLRHRRQDSMLTILDGLVTILAFSFSYYLYLQSRVHSPPRTRSATSSQRDGFIIIKSVSHAHCLPEHSSHTFVYPTLTSSSMCKR